MARPRHIPTDDSRRVVEVLAGHGIPQDEIGLVINATGKTLRRYYPRELEAGMARARAQVVTTAFEMATSGRCPAMTIFWLKTRLGWRERDAREVEPQTATDLTNEQLAAEIVARHAASHAKDAR